MINAKSKFKKNNKVYIYNYGSGDVAYFTKYVVDDVIEEGGDVSYNVTGVEQPFKNIPLYNMYECLLDKVKIDINNDYMVDIKHLIMALSKLEYGKVKKIDNTFYSNLRTYYINFLKDKPDKLIHKNCILQQLKQKHNLISDELYLDYISKNHNECFDIFFNSGYGKKYNSILYKAFSNLNMESDFTMGDLFTKGFILLYELIPKAYMCLRLERMKDNITEYQYDIIHNGNIDLDNIDIKRIMRGTK